MDQLNMPDNVELNFDDAALADDLSTVTARTSVPRDTNTTGLFKQILRKPEHWAMKGILERFDDVWNLLNTDRDVQRVTDIPGRHSLDKSDALNQVKLQYTHWDGDADDSPTSKTSFHNGLTVKIIYTEDEVKECPEIIEAREIHEFTHAIRYAIVCHYNHYDGPQKQDKKPKHTPTKVPKEGSFKIHEHAWDDLYKLEGVTFHSGFLVEHMLCGGVWVLLTGEYAEKKEDILRPIDDAHKYMRIVLCDYSGPTLKDASGDPVDTAQLTGYLKGSETMMKLFHHGDRISRISET